MSEFRPTCPDCDDQPTNVDRRDFLRSAAIAGTAVVAGAAPVWAVAKKASKKKSKPESVVKLLYGSLTDAQKKEVAFAWDHQDKSRGLLRTRISNNWRITKPAINSAFYTGEQQQMIRDIYEGIFSPEWVGKMDKQLKDDAGGFGKSQGIALFGDPSKGKFEFVMTGRHMTIRCDGNSEDHVAFGGPIFYGHAARGFNEKPDHPGNVFWHQAVAANKLYQMLSGKQQKQALESNTPREQKVPFQGAKGDFLGIPIADLAADQKEHMQKVLKILIEPYRKSDQDEVVKCLAAQGGLDKCHLAFFSDKDIGNDKVWDNWRLEGPAFVWHFRGAPHVHAWVNVADDSAVKLNA
jgi:hypothetical protein